MNWPCALFRHSIPMETTSTASNLSHATAGIRVDHPYIDDAELHTDEIVVGELPLTEHQSMQFQYDFGAGWQFHGGWE